MKEKISLCLNLPIKDTYKDLVKFYAPNYNHGDLKPSHEDMENINNFYEIYKKFKSEITLNYPIYRFSENGSEGLCVCKKENFLKLNLWLCRFVFNFLDLILWRNLKVNVPKYGTTWAQITKMEDAILDGDELTVDWRISTLKYGINKIITGINDKSFLDLHDFKNYERHKVDTFLMFLRHVLNLLAFISNFVGKQKVCKNAARSYRVFMEGYCMSTFEK